MTGATAFRWAAFCLVLGTPATAADFPTTSVAMLATRTDVWAEAAIRQPGGPSYEFFRDLLPPLRYVNTAFRHYPIVLSGLKAPVKARWVSNGSAINPRAEKPPMWKEAGVPVHFFVGDKPESFGDDLGRLDGPRYLDGWLPVVQLAYRHGGGTVEQEAFAPVREPLVGGGAICLRFTARGAANTVTAQMRAEGRLTANGRTVTDDQKRGWGLFGAAWQWDGERKELRTRLEPGQSADLVILTQPLSAAPTPGARPSRPLSEGGRDGRAPEISAGRYDEERRACVETWGALLSRGMVLEVPEPVVQNAWRALVVGNFMIAVGDRMHYSAGNAYDHLYEAECGDAARALMLYDFTDDARRMVGPLLDFNRPVTRFHVAGHKLQLLAHYYGVTRDADYLRAREPVWGPVIDFVVGSRRTANGLLPPDRYAGDIAQDVHSLSSNAACWRGLRDMAFVLDDLGQHDRAARLRDEVKAYRAAILDAVAKSERSDVRPPFLPIALLSHDPPFDPLTATRLGSYYCLMAPYVLGSDLFAGTERETWLIDYLRQHGGLAMGMIRSTPAQGEFQGETGVNVLYGLRYMQTILRRGDREHALAGFYGQLAQGMTRDTFIGGEGSRFFHGDRQGRSFYLPPNSASNAMFLQTLRYLLVQDWEDADGRPHELRLLDAIPGRWLADGAALRLERAPTLFGPVSVRTESRLSRGEVLVHVEAPPRPPAKWALRLPLPPGWKATAASVGAAGLPLGPGGVVDLTGRVGQLTVRFNVEAAAP